MVVAAFNIGLFLLILDLKYDIDITAAAVARVEFSRICQLVYRHL